MRNTIDALGMDSTLSKKKINGSIYPILLAVIPGSFLSHFSAGLVNIALTDISLDLNISLSLSQWIVTGYLLSVMIFLPIMGKFSDRFGRKNIHNMGYVMFGVGILFSYLSTSIVFLLISRIIQGIGAAMLQSVNMVIIVDNVPKEKRVQALGLIGTAVGMGGFLGAPIGGILIGWFSWHTLFIIQLPIILTVLIIAIFFIPKDAPTQKSKFDLMGASIFSISLVCIIYILNEIGEGVFYRNQLMISILGIICFVLFLYRSKTNKNPFIDIKMFMHPIVKSGSFIIIGSYAACFAAIVVLPFYFRGVLQTSATVAGLFLMIYPLFLSIFGPLSGRLTARFGSFKSVQMALLLMIGTFGILSMISMNTSLYFIFIILATLGISMGLLTSPNYDLIMKYVPAYAMGEIGGTIALLRNLGMVIGTALGIAIVNYSAIVPVTEWLALDTYQDKISILKGIKDVFIFFTIALSCLYGLLFFVQKKKTIQ